MQTEIHTVVQKSPGFYTGFSYVKIFWKVSAVINRWPVIAVYKMMLILCDKYANEDAEGQWRHPTWRTF